jgi:hypothetical protein
MGVSFQTESDLKAYNKQILCSFWTLYAIEVYPAVPFGCIEYYQCLLQISDTGILRIMEAGHDR